MAVCEQAEQEPIDQVFLTYHHSTDLVAQGRDPVSQLLDLLGNLLR
jgi:hypothetical protein